jgi:hypothetical protein
MLPQWAAMSLHLKFNPCSRDPCCRRAGSWSSRASCCQRGEAPHSSRLRTEPQSLSCPHTCPARTLAALLFCGGDGFSRLLVWATSEFRAGKVAPILCVGRSPQTVRVAGGDGFEPPSGALNESPDSKMRCKAFFAPFAGGRESGKMLRLQRTVVLSHTTTVASKVIFTDSSLHPQFRPVFVLQNCQIGRYLRVQTSVRKPLVKKLIHSPLGTRSDAAHKLRNP